MVRSPLGLRDVRLQPQMPKYIHEIRDPIHVFIRVNSDERLVLNSRPFQRLRYIHQLALTFLIYPGATNRRFEHSLGVMELASRVFDVITKHYNVAEVVQELLPELNQNDKLVYWKRVLRIAALCHDMGHLPFSHAAEDELLPDGWDHERLTRVIIESDEMQQIWRKMTPPLRSDDIVKVAVGKKKAKDLQFSDWESILAEVITGDAFGVDRMDYLLRDAYHAGVAYGRFDHHRLIDTLRILPVSPSDETEGSREPALGVEQGGIESAEALLLARYFMFSQMYFHDVRRIYDIHLKDFLQDWLPNGEFGTEIGKHLDMTDNEVMAAIAEAANSTRKSGRDHARRIVSRKHFKTLYERNPEDANVNPEAAKAIYQAAVQKYGKEYVRHDQYHQKGSLSEFPVKMNDGRIERSTAVSDVLRHLPLVSIDYVFIDESISQEAKTWLESKRSEIIQN